ncbi:MAG: exodeoxyribonuclease VII large subunit [Gammaproteobacteria bacterium]
MTEYPQPAAIESGASSGPSSLRSVWSVSQLNREVRALLEGHFPLVWVEGELSNLARPASGHIYFSLKDEQAQVRCAMFRMRNMHLGFTPENGMQVLVRARIGLYEPRGEFQLRVEHMEPAGDGALRRAFDALKARLEREGLFDAAHKRPLPAHPRAVGVITSPSGAAIRDILTTLRRRFPALPVIVYPVPVQGAGSAEKIAAMLERAGRRGECDVLLLARGGGSLEDLWAFNEEVVARAIRACPLPVVSGIGHEVDFTIADFAADQRAPTPTGAAELVSPNQTEWLTVLARQGARLRWLMESRLARSEERLAWLGKRLRHPGRRLQDIAQRVDELDGRLRRAQQALLREAGARLRTLTAELTNHSPAQRLGLLEARRVELARRLRSAWSHGLGGREQRLGAAARALEAVSPLATLARGYAIVRTVPAGRVVRRADEVRPGERVEARLGVGRLVCNIDEVHDE